MLVYADGFSPWKMTMTYCTKYEDLVSNYKYIVSRLEATVTRRWSIDEKHSVSSIKLHVLTLSHADRRGRMTSCRSWIRCCWSPSLEESAGQTADCSKLGDQQQRIHDRQDVNLLIWGRTTWSCLTSDDRSWQRSWQLRTGSHMWGTVVADCKQPYKVAQQAWIPLAVARVANVAIG